jgi:uncharacterized membrane protein (UPF0127 family)
MKRDCLKKSFFSVLFFLLLLWSFPDLSGAQQQTARIRIQDRIYCFEVAATEQARQQGLMFRKELKENSGMLFVYPDERHMSFYMRNTYIPLDIAFIDQNCQIVEIRRMYPRDETPVRSGKKAMYALEVNRGFFDRTGLAAGAQLHFVGEVPGVEQNQ